MSEAKRFRSPDELPEDAREHLADLLLLLADNKRILGLRYANWILGAPALEAGISCSAMAQDEWGHGRILYAMLRDFDRDPDTLEHEREPEAYRSCALLDEEPEGWPELLALNALLDTALSVQFEAMRESAFEPVHYKVSKLLDEERFHYEHGRGWVARLAATERGREALEEAFRPAWRECLRWFGPDDDALGNRLAAVGVTDAGPAVLRARWLARVAPLVKQAGFELADREDGEWRSRVEVGWESWDGDRRRDPGAPGPDARIVERARGDKNRALLMD